jgi:putative hemolysin
MSAVLPQLVLIVVLVILNAAFAGTELALVSLREGQLQRLETKSSTGALLARLARQPNQFLATIQIGITLAGFLASAAAAVSLAEPLEEPLSFLGGAAGPVSIIVVTLILSYITLVFGELAPKRVAMQKAERWGMVMARPLAILSTLTRPIVWLLSKSTDVAVRVMGADPSIQREEVTEEELRDMVAIQPTFTPEQRQVLDGAFEVAERTLDEVLVPRSDVVMLDAAWTFEEARAALVESGHSRAPVATARNLDQVIGVVHLRQLVGDGDRTVGDDGRRREGTVLVAEVAHDLVVFPEAARVLTTLRELQLRRAQMALVINEHGGAEGIVTVEDLVEELVGEIYDETDRDLLAVRHEPDGVIVVPGRFPIHDLRDIGVDLPAGDYATIAGLVLECLGRIPDIGDRCEVGGWSIEVRAMHRHGITELALSAADGGDASRASEPPDAPSDT